MSMIPESSGQCGLLDSPEDVFLSTPEGRDSSAPLIVRPIVCRSCGLTLAGFSDPNVPTEPFGPPVPIFIRPMGCLCTLRPAWLRAMLEDAAAGVVRDCAFAGRLFAVLSLSGLPSSAAADVVRGMLPLNARLQTWAHEWLSLWESLRRAEGE